MTGFKPPYGEEIIYDKKFNETCRNCHQADCCKQPCKYSESLFGMIKSCEL